MCINIFNPNNIYYLFIYLLEKQHSISLSLFHILSRSLLSFFIFFFAPADRHYIFISYLCIRILLF